MSGLARRRPRRLRRVNFVVLENGGQVLHERRHPMSLSPWAEVAALPRSG